MAVEMSWPIGYSWVRKMDTDLWEVRSDISDRRICRVFFTISGRQLVLLHGIIKKTSKTLQDDLDLARKWIYHGPPWIGFWIHTTILLLFQPWRRLQISLGKNWSCNCNEEWYILIRTKVEGKSRWFLVSFHQLAAVPDISASISFPLFCSKIVKYLLT